MKKWIALFLVFSFLFILPINASNNLLNLNSTTVYTIDQPYEYPIIPGTPQWLTLKDHQEMIDACEIPSEIVSKMTTDALLKSYLNYPLSVDMYAYDSLNNGFEILKSFHMLGLDELISRPD